MRVVIVGDRIAEQFGQRLQAIGQREARRVLIRGLNRGGKQAFVQVKRSLVEQTGIKYGQINRAVVEIKAGANLAYTIAAHGNETNINLFGATQRNKGVSAAPWGKRRIFRKTFIVPAYGSRAFLRTTGHRGPLRQLFGPNIAREIVKSPTLERWQTVSGFVMNHIASDLSRLFK